MYRGLVTRGHASLTSPSPRPLSPQPFTVSRSLKSSASSPRARHPEPSVPSDPASYGGRSGGPKSGRKTIGRGSWPAAPAARGGQIGPGQAAAGRREPAGPPRGDDGGHEPTDRAESQDAQVRKATAGRPACSGRDHCLRPNRGCGAGAEPDWERRGQTYRAASGSEASHILPGQYREGCVGSNPAPPPNSGHQVLAHLDAPSRWPSWVLEEAAGLGC